MRERETTTGEIPDRRVDVFAVEGSAHSYGERLPGESTGKEKNNISFAIVQLARHPRGGERVALNKNYGPRREAR